MRGWVKHMVISTSGGLNLDDMQWVIMVNTLPPPYGVRNIVSTPRTAPLFPHETTDVAKRFERMLLPG